MSNDVSTKSEKYRSFMGIVRNRNKPKALPPPPPAITSFEQRIIKLRILGKRRGKRNTVVGIIISFLIAVCTIYGGYYLLGDVIKITGQTHKDAAMGLIDKREARENGFGGRLGACFQDADCAEVGVDCCDCHFGGRQVAINRRYLTQWEEGLKERCGNVTCAARENCRSGKAICRDGKCVFASVPAGSVKASSTKDDTGENGIIKKKSGASVADWQTYRSKKYGFEFRYHPTAHSTSSLPNSIILQDKNKFFVINPLPERYQAAPCENEKGCYEVAGLKYDHGADSVTVMEKLKGETIEEVLTKLIESEGKNPDNCKIIVNGNRAKIELKESYNPECSSKEKEIMGGYCRDIKLEERIKSVCSQYAVNGVAYQIRYFIFSPQPARYFLMYYHSGMDVPDISLNSIKFLDKDSASSVNGGVKNIDSDGDGLSDKDEYIYGTDPHNPDTDGDGFLDGDEVNGGYNPRGSGKL